MKTKRYAVFVRKYGEWLQQSIPFTDYKEAQEHAKLVQRYVLFVEKNTRQTSSLKKKRRML